ncbi:helix-turn-helix transcriptional regulator [Vibrio vulnificus]
MNRANIIGLQMKAIRKRLKITQSDLSAKCCVLGFDCTRVTIAKIELGTRQVTDLEAKVVSQALKVSVQELFE